MTEEEWNKQRRENNYPWMTDDQWQCYLMLCDLMGGSHHITGKVKCYGSGIENNYSGGLLATFDFDLLTRIVLMSHERMIRVEIGSSGPRMVKLMFWKRHTREGRIHERHPTIEQALKKYAEI